ncbi:TetR/AcrR family transcriptional regulator [Acinetobacter baumannii]|nr:TetR/AcrR family transcriptional regulator [Acinetobacter baumannii]HCW5913683.1 TetR/AcrR family transcriptional regulator [Acinetobacter baumannii]
MRKFAQKEKDILETAYTLFKRNSFLRIGVDRIIADSVVAKMTFYKYFPSKDHLILDCLKYEVFNIQNALKSRIFDAKPNGNLACLQTIYNWHLEQVSELDYRSNLIIKSSIELTHVPEARLIIAEYNAWLFEVLSTLLEDLHITDKTIPKVIFNLLSGILLPTSLYLPQWEDIERLITASCPIHNDNVCVVQ